MNHMKYILADEHFAIDQVHAVAATEEKRQQFITMMEELYAIGYMSVVSVDFQSKDRGKKLYTHVYIQVSITGVSFKLKITLLNQTEVLNAMLRYSNSSVAKQSVNRHIRQLILSTKEQNSEK